MWALVFQPWKDEPTYHLYGSSNGREDFTKCGRPVGEYKPWLPLKHAVKFAKPCKGCVPEVSPEEPLETVVLSDA